MYRGCLSLALLMAAFLTLAATPVGAQPMKKVLTDVKITCPDPELFEFKAGTCQARMDVVGALGEDKCNVPGVAWDGKNCAVVQHHAPTPKCPATEPPSAFDAKLGQCVVTDDRPRSSLGNYLGDCFRVRTLPEPAPRGLVSGQTYKVMSQRPEGDSDKLLRLSPAKSDGQFKCSSDKAGEQFDAKASDLIAIGADRAGWTYGVLALPYKFHFSDKSFGSGVSIGPYFGRRWGTPGSASTLALAATIGSVKGEVRDAQNNITSTPDLQAFSFAIGLMFDIANGAATRPFKIGVFMGTDVVGADNTVKYKHNKKPWLALQIGFDFTDN